MVTNSTLYTLLKTVHLNQTHIIMPALTEILVKLAAQDAKLNAIIRQVTPPETGDFNADDAVIR